MSTADSAATYEATSPVMRASATSDPASSTAATMSRGSALTLAAQKSTSERTRASSAAASYPLALLPPAVVRSTVSAGGGARSGSSRYASGLGPAMTPCSWVPNATATSAAPASSGATLWRRDGLGTAVIVKAPCAAVDGL